MKLLVGLGNPGPKYETTRHNVGFLALDRLIDRFSAEGPTKKFDGQLYQASLRGEGLILVKPQTFMNLSGKCVGPLFRFYRLKPADLIVIHDDLDLQPLSLRIKQGGGNGGHNGLKSLEEHLGKEQMDFFRMRIGIGHPTALGLKTSPVNYVLELFKDDELKALDALLDQVVEAVELILAGDALGAMNRFNSRKKKEEESA